MKIHEDEDVFDMSELNVTDADDASASVVDEEFVEDSEKGDAKDVSELESVEDIVTLDVADVSTDAVLSEVKRENIWSSNNALTNTISFHISIIF